MNEMQRTDKDFSEGERREKVQHICDCFLDCFEKTIDGWEDLNAFAHIAFLEAERFLVIRDFKEFALRFRMYSYIWRLASEMLSPREYRYFCAGQSSLINDCVM